MPTDWKEMHRTLVEASRLDDRLWELSGRSNTSWRLPPDVMRLVLGYCPLGEVMTVAALVCRSWRAMASRSGVWDTFSLSTLVRVPGVPTISPFVATPLTHSQIREQYWLAQLARQYANCRTVDLSSATRLGAKSLMGVVGACLRVTSIDFSMSNLDDSMVDAMVGVPTSCLQGLRHLTLSVCDRLSEGGLTQLISACPNLRVLRVSHLTQVGGTPVLEAVCRSCSYIEELQMTGFPFVSPTTTLELPSLSHLNLSYSIVPGVVLEGLCARFPSMTTLTLSHVEELRDGGFLSMLRRCGGGLHRININGTLLGTSVGHLPQPSPLLTHLYISKTAVSGEEVVSVVEGCPMLAQLDISHCSGARRDLLRGGVLRGYLRDRPTLLTEASITYCSGVPSKR